MAERVVKTAEMWRQSYMKQYLANVPTDISYSKAAEYINAELRRQWEEVTNAE